MEKVVNFIRIINDDGKAEAIFRCLTTNGEFDFNKVVTAPSGTKNWESWRKTHWGTCWNALRTRWSGDETIDKVVEFETSRTAPEPIFAEMCKRYPDAPMFFDSMKGESFSVYKNVDGELYKIDYYDSETGEGCCTYCI